MNDFQQAALSVIKEISIQLILIAVGAMAVAGSVLGARTKATVAKRKLTWGMALLMLSVVCGIVALGSAVSQLTSGSFDAYDPILRFAYMGQLLFVVIGGALFVWYLKQNIP